MCRWLPPGGPATPSNGDGGSGSPPRGCDGPVTPSNGGGGGPARAGAGVGPRRPRCTAAPQAFFSTPLQNVAHSPLHQMQLTARHPRAEVDTARCRTDGNRSGTRREHQSTGEPPAWEGQGCQIRRTWYPSTGSSEVASRAARKAARRTRRMRHGGSATASKSGCAQAPGQLRGQWMVH